MSNYRTTYTMSLATLPSFYLRIIYLPIILCYVLKHWYSLLYMNRTCMYSLSSSDKPRVNTSLHVIHGVGVLLFWTNTFFLWATCKMNACILKLVFMIVEKNNNNLKSDVLWHCSPFSNVNGHYKSYLTPHWGGYASFYNATMVHFSQALVLLLSWPDEQSPLKPRKDPKRPTSFKETHC